MSKNPASDPKVRRTGLGGSDLAKLFNLSKHGDVHSLWMEKRGLLIPEDISQKGVIKRGNKLESIVADEFEEDYRLHLGHPTYTFKGELPWQFAHPDRTFRSKKGEDWGLEIKTAAHHIFQANVMNGLDLGYLLQSVYYLYITKFKGWVLRMKHPDSWADHDFIIRRDQSTDAIYEMIVERGNWFWDLVLTATEPPVEDAPKNMPAVPEGELLQVGDDQVEHWMKVAKWLREAQQSHAETNHTVELAKLAVKKVMTEFGWTAVEGPATETKNLRVYLRPQKGKPTYKGKDAVSLLDSIAELVQNDDWAGLTNLMAGYKSSQFITISKSSTPLRPFWINAPLPKIEGDTK